MGVIPPQTLPPSLSNWVLHFTVRDGFGLPNPGATARSRFEQIVCEQRIQGNPTYWSRRQRPAVCVAECREDDLSYLVRHRGWQPWALAFQVGTIEAAGGAPVWHVRTDLLNRIRDEDTPLAVEISDWIVRWETSPQGRSDWRHEREWRIPGEYLDLRVVRPVAFIVGDSTWSPPSCLDPNLGNATRVEHSIDSLSWAREIPRFWWNQVDQRLGFGLQTD